MSEEKPKKPINFGDSVTFQEPKKPEPSGRDGSVPAFLILIVVIGLILILGGRGGSSTPPATPAPGQPTPPFVPPQSGTGFVCQPGIEVGTTVNVVYDKVRMRRSAGYINKNDAIDSIHYVTPGDTAQVKGGPERRDGLCWWLIEHAGIEGWTADHSRDGTLLLAAGQ